MNSASTGFPATPPVVSTATTSTLAPVQARRRLRWWHVVLGILALGFISGIALIVTLVMSFMVGGDVRALRDAALDAAPGTWNRQVEFGVGRLPVFLARQGLSFAPIPPEARTALSALQSADVSIYERRHGSPTPDPDVVFEKVRATMESKGWEPVVLVREDSDIVGVFVPKAVGSSDRLNACVFVMEDSELVVVSARARLEPLVELAMSHMDRVPFLRKK